MVGFTLLELSKLSVTDTGYCTHIVTTQSVGAAFRQQNIYYYAKAVRYSLAYEEPLVN